MTLKDELKNYITAPEAGEILGLKKARIGQLCRAGRFNGAVKVGDAWMIPREAVLSHKPLPPGVKPDTQSKKAKLAAERAEILEQAKVTKAVLAYTVDAECLEQAKEASEE